MLGIEPILALTHCAVCYFLTGRGQRRRRVRLGQPDLNRKRDSLRLAAGPRGKNQTTRVGKDAGGSGWDSLTYTVGEAVSTSPLARQNRGAVRKMTSGVRLAGAGVLISVVTAYMGYVGAAASWKYYMTVDECLAASSSLVGARLRVSGTVAAGTLVGGSHQSAVSFALIGGATNLQVSLSGRPPDNLAEDREVVVEGQLMGDAHLRAIESSPVVPASTYLPPGIPPAGLMSS